MINNSEYPISVENLKQFHQDLDVFVDQIIRDKETYNDIIKHFIIASEDLLAKSENKDDDSEGESEVSKITLTFNGKTYFTRENESSVYTVSSMPNLKRKFFIRLKVVQGNPNTTCIGISTKPIFKRDTFLGDEGLGEWSIAGNGVIREEGTQYSKQGIKFSGGDEIMIKAQNGIITYGVNGKFDDYSYYFTKRNFYLGVSVCFIGDQIQIIEAIGN